MNLKNRSHRLNIGSECLRVRIKGALTAQFGSKRLTDTDKAQLDPMLPTAKTRNTLQICHLIKQNRLLA